MVKSGLKRISMRHQIASDEFMFCKQCGKITLKNSLCNQCWRRLRETTYSYSRDVNGLPIFTLWQWPVNHSLKALWLQNLKGNESEKLWFEIAEVVHQALNVNLYSLDKKTLWIPLPSSGPRNHALGLAKALAIVYGGTVWDGLEITPEEQHQKDKTRFERQKRHILTKGRPPCSSFKTVCLVDDIITTGSTFRGAFSALEHPKNGLGIALMDRPLHV